MTLTKEDVEKYKNDYANNVHEDSLSILSETFVEKLRSLRVDCALLHDTLENALLSSGVCKKYTNDNTEKDYAPLTSIGHRRIITDDPRKFQVNAAHYESCANNYEPSSILRNLEWDSPKTELYDEHISWKPYMKLTESSKRRIDDSDSGRSSRQSSSSSFNKSSSKPPYVWQPRTTVPEPFKMSTREPIKATYSQKFLQKLLEEKTQREKEENDRMQMRIKFKSTPVPQTTYKPASNFYIGTLKRSKSAHQISQNISKMKKAVSQPEIWVQPRANSVPITTYIRPSTSSTDLREQRKHQRAAELLKLATEPRGMVEHTIRSHVVYQVRHAPKCLPQKPKFQPNISKSVPDFRLLQHRFEDKLQQETSKRPTTIVIPFHFSNTYHRHHCKNMDEYMPYYKRSKSNKTHSLSWSTLTR